MTIPHSVETATSPPPTSAARPAVPERTPSRRSLLGAALGGPVIMFGAGACGSDDSANADSGALVYPTGTITLTVPADPGGGLDLTARTLQTVIEQNGLTDQGVVVRNAPGAGGTVGLKRFLGERNPNALLVMSKSVIGSIATNKAKIGFDDTAAIARLTSEYQVMVVPTDSPYKTLKDFVAAWKADPGNVTIAGSPPGGVDSLVVGELASRVGVTRSEIAYTGYQGAGALTPPLLSGEVAVAVEGVAELSGLISSGKVRPLAVSSDTQVGVIDAPTFSEQGFDVVVGNWRGVVAPKSISKAERAAIIGFFGLVRGAEGWRKALVTNGWQDQYLAGDEFTKYIAGEQQRSTKVLTELGLITL
ncbi:MAG: Bug family tripartite tricarboxylate transporter substrate binding protein [Dermatophilaceae bacterium]